MNTETEKVYNKIMDDFSIIFSENIKSLSIDEVNILMKELNWTLPSKMIYENYNREIR